jgi:hypothetical protein
MLRFVGEIYKGVVGSGIDRHSDLRDPPQDKIVRAGVQISTQY